MNTKNNLSTKKILTTTAVAAATLAAATVVTANNAHAATVAPNTSESTDNQLAQAQQNVKAKQADFDSASQANDQAIKAVSDAQQNVNTVSQAVSNAQLIADQASQTAQADSQAVSAASDAVQQASDQVSAASEAATNLAQVQDKLSQAQASQSSIAAENVDNRLQSAVTDAQTNVNNANEAKSSAEAASVQAQNKLKTTQEQLNNNHSGDVTTENLINAPKDYNDFYEDGRGLVEVITPLRMYGDHGDQIQFMPQKYSVTDMGVESPTFSDIQGLVNKFHSSSVDDGHHQVVFAYVDNDGKVHLTADINEVLKHDEQPVTAWLLNTNGLDYPASPEFEMPISVAYYSYEDGVTPDRYVKYGYAKTWNEIPDYKKATARVYYNTALSYVSNSDLDKINVPDALNLNADVQQQLTEYAANIINHFNEQAGFPGRVVANSVAIQKTNYIAQMQHSPRNHDTENTTAVHSDGEDMYLDILHDTQNVSLDTLFKDVHDAIMNMLFPNVQAGDDWGHAELFFRGAESGSPVRTEQSPAKLGIAFDKFGNLHFDVYAPQDVDFSKSQDFKSSDNNGRNQLQQAVDEAKAAAQMANENLSKANEKLDQAKAALTQAQTALDNWTAAKKSADDKVATLQKAVDSVDPSALKKAQDTLANAQQELVAAQQKSQQSSKAYTDAQAALTSANAQLKNANEALIVAQNHQADTQTALTTAQNALAAAQKALHDQEAVHGDGNVTPVKQLDAQKYAEKVQVKPLNITVGDSVPEPTLVNHVSKVAQPTVNRSALVLAAALADTDDLPTLPAGTHAEWLNTSKVNSDAQQVGNYSEDVLVTFPDQSTMILAAQLNVNEKHQNSGSITDNLGSNINEPINNGSSQSSDKNETQGTTSSTTGSTSNSNVSDTGHGEANNTETENNATDLTSNPNVNDTKHEEVNNTEDKTSITGSLTSSSTTNHDDAVVTVNEAQSVSTGEQYKTQKAKQSANTLPQTGNNANEAGLLSGLLLIGLTMFGFGAKRKF